MYSFSKNNSPENEKQEINDCLYKLINQIVACLNFMREIVKSEENSGTFNNLSVLKKQIEEATEIKECTLFCSRLEDLSKIGKIICKKFLDSSGKSSSKKLALNSNLRTFDKQAKKWSADLTAWNGRYKLALKNIKK